MSLHFILGPSGSGKTHTLYETILSQAEKEPGRMFYVIVPEQFTMQTQKELTARHRRHAIMNIDVVSFDRLASRIFDELGRHELTVLEDTGKNLLLRKIAEKEKEQLKTLKQNIHRMGYIDQIKSLISEFMQYGLSPDQLKTYLASGPKASALSYKLEDLLRIYTQFYEELKGRFVTSETLLTVLAQCVEDSSLLKGAVFAFDCFTGFTPVQMQLVRKLMQTARDLYVTVCMDTNGELYADRGMQELFFMSRKMIRALSKMAVETGCGISDPVLLARIRGRFKAHPVLGFLEEHLFRPGKQVYPLERNAGKEIAVYSLSNPKEELLFAAQTIRELLRQGYRYRDIAIVSGNAACYEHYAKEIFRTYEIAFFSDTKESILFHPFTEWVRAVLEVMERDFSYESVFRYLRTGLCGFETDEIDILENYVLERGIRGIRRWKEKWVRPPKQAARGIVSEEEEQLLRLQELNGFRERLLSQLSAVRKVFAGRKSTVRQMTEVLYELMTSLGMQEQLAAKQKVFEQRGEEVQAAVYGQIYRIVIDLMDKVVELLGEEHMPAREYADLLDAGFSAAKAGTIPPGADCVILGDIERTRLDHIKILLFLGVNDGIIPKRADRGSLLSQYEREVLAEASIELAPTAREQVFLQRFYLYLNMTKPSHRLILTFGRMDSQGSAQKPSYLIGTICQMFPDITIREGSVSFSGEAMTPKSSLTCYVEGLTRARDHCMKQEPSEEWMGLHQWLIRQPEWEDRIRKIFDGAFACYDGERLNPDTAKALYGRELHNSVTRLETFAQCAYAHFLDYGLKLARRQEFVFEAADLGTVFHDALERYSQMVREAKISWFDMDETKQEEFLDQAVTDTVLGTDTSVLEDNSRGRYMVERIRKILARSVWALTAQVQQGLFHPKFYEERFWREIPLKNQGKMCLSGRIDRIDTYENEKEIYMKILDYKSGRKKFQLADLYYGLQLQLVTYLNAAEEKQKREDPIREVIPAGILYYHMDDPMVEAAEDEDPKQIEDALLEALRPEGLINRDTEVIRKLDTGFTGKSKVIPVSFKKDGTLSAKGCSVASREQFEALGSFVEKQISETAERILGGEIEPRPMELKDLEACRYCPYQSVCHFDSKIPGYEKNKPEQLSEEELWNRIQEGETWK